jgi:hypothetical protein
VGVCSGAIRHVTVWMDMLLEDMCQQLLQETAGMDRTEILAVGVSGPCGLFVAKSLATTVAYAP